MTKKEQFNHFNACGNHVWSLIVENVNQDKFNHSLYLNGLEQVTASFAEQNHNFGRHVAVTFDQETQVWSVSRQQLESDLVYFFESKNGLVISNNLVRIRELSGLHELDKTWMLSFFSFTNDFSHASPIQGISILPPCSQLTVSNQGYHIDRQTVSARQDTQQWSTARWIEEWQACNSNAILDSVGNHESIAIMLSSGIDSGGIAAYLKQQYKHKSKSPTIKGFSWRFPKHKQADESSYIQSLVKHLNLEHEFIDIEDAQCFSDVSNWPVAIDAPYFNAMRHMKEKLYQTVDKQKIEVLLNGHIGDDLCFVDRYIIAELWKDNKRAWVKELANLLVKQGFSIRKDSSFRYWLKQMLGINDKKRLPPSIFSSVAKIAYQNSFLGEVLSTNRAEQFGMLTAPSELNAIATERAFTQAYGIERRHPYLHPELVSLALACPAYLLSTHQQTKWISRQALSPLLPQSLLNRQRVGQLDELFEQGLEQNVGEIKEYLFRSERRWPEFIREEVVVEILDKRLWNQVPLSVVSCLGFERWLDEWRAVGLPVL